MKIRELLDIVANLADTHNIHTPYIVGGIPRNIILDVLNNLHDIDLTTGYDDVHQLADLLASYLGVEAKLMKDGHKKIVYEGISIDFSSNFKYENISEILAKVGIKDPDELTKETYSRDFTVNTLLLPLDFSRVIDLTGKGIDDVQAKIIRCPVDPDLAMKESPIRMLRSFYYAAKYDLKVSDDVIEAVKRNLVLLKQVNRHYAGEKINEILRFKPEMLEQLIEVGITKVVPLTKDLSRALIKSKRLLDVI